MWHSISHFAHTNGYYLAFALLAFLIMLFLRMVETKRPLSAVVFLALATFVWVAIKDASPQNILGFLLFCLGSIGIMTLQNRQKAANKPSA